jgi:hypothetical protein
MAMAPSNNPMRAAVEELWGEEPIVTSSASAPALQETPRYVRREPSRDREREEDFRDHPRSSSTEKRDQYSRSETQPLLFTRSYLGEDPSMVSVSRARKIRVKKQRRLRSSSKRWVICRFRTQRSPYNLLRDRRIVVTRPRNGWNNLVVM